MEKSDNMNAARLINKHISNTPSEGDGKRDGSTQLIDKHTGSTFRGIAAVMVILSHYAEWYSLFLQTQGRAETFRIALTKLGVYGVDIFFLLSGYAMVKSFGSSNYSADGNLAGASSAKSSVPNAASFGSSAHNGNMNPGFALKRIKNVYIPYFIVTGIIELISGGFTSLHEFWLFACGYDYWYMNVLFVFYIGFIAIYALVKNKALKLAAFSVFTYIYSYTLYKNGMQDFWYVSNIAFALGVIVSECDNIERKPQQTNDCRVGFRISECDNAEKKPYNIYLKGKFRCKHFSLSHEYKDERKTFPTLESESDKTEKRYKYAQRIIEWIWLPMLAILSVGMFFVIKSALFDTAWLSRYTDEELIWGKIGATLIWTLFVLVLASKWRIREPIFAFLGKISLYLYLTHTYIFMRCVNSLTCPVMARFAISALITVVISFLCSLAVTGLQKLPKLFAQRL